VLDGKICVNGGSYDVRPSTAFCHYEDSSIRMFSVLEGNKISESEFYKSEFARLSVKYDVNELAVKANQVHAAAIAYRAVVDTVPYIFRETLNAERLTRN